MSIGLPGPTKTSHQPGSSSASCRATCESPDRAWQISTALSRLRIELPVGLERHGHLGQPPAKLQLQRLAEGGVLRIFQRPSGADTVGAFKGVGAWSEVRSQGSVEE